MINVKSEIQYILVTQTLEDMAQAGFLTAEELTTAKRLAVEKYRPSTVWE
ncbi:hypothetical protein [uncultured Oscillibacter sp.]|nr:hypothetical protein [uncultured Oscillibacter sp.]